jgi:hypothetical protein
MNIHVLLLGQARLIQGEGDVSTCLVSEVGTVHLMKSSRTQKKCHIYKVYTIIRQLKLY